MKIPFQVCPTAEEIHFNMNFVFGKWYDRPAWWLLRSQWWRWSKRMLPKRFQTQPLLEILQNPSQTVKELFPISTQNCIWKNFMLSPIELDRTMKVNSEDGKLLNKRENIIKEWCPFNSATLCTLKPFCRRMNQIVAPVWPLPGVKGILHRHFFSTSTSSILTSSWIFWNISPSFGRIRNMRSCLWAAAQASCIAFSFIMLKNIKSRRWTFWNIKYIFALLKQKNSALKVQRGQC